MRKQGRRTTALTTKEKNAIVEYLRSDKTLEELGAKLGMTKGQFRYRVERYKKEMGLVDNGGSSKIIG